MGGVETETELARGPEGDASLAAARERFLTEDLPQAGGVRDPIWSSWQRARSLDLAADRVQPPWRPDSVQDTALTLAAEPVVRTLRHSLEGLAVSLIVTDQKGLVLRRETTDSALARRLDSVHLAPGFSYNEAEVGTNGIGTSLERAGATCVVGHEHYAENLADLGCAAAPVKHPLTGRVLGALNLTTWRADAGPVLLALARSTAERLSSEVGEQADVASRLLVDTYLRTHRRVPGAVLAVNHELALVNDAARADLTEAERAHLLDAALDVMASGRSAEVGVEVGGHGAVLRCRVVTGPSPGSPGGTAAAGVAGVVATLLRRLDSGGATAPLAAATVGTSKRLSAWQVLERAAIVAALDEARGDKGVAAENLGMSRATIYRRIRAYRIT